MARFNRVAGILLCVLCMGATLGCPNPPRAGESRVFDGIAFQWCPAGTFAMGSPSSEPGHNYSEVLHEVTLSEGFWLGKCEFTQAQWEDVMGTNPSQFAGDDRPVETVSWDDIQEFLVVLNASTSGGSYRLPTEAEWEYACRAGTTTRFYWGSDPQDTEIGNYAWYWANDESRPSAVGQKTPNAWGLCDMSGNVFEMTQDYFAPYPTGPVTDPQGPSTGTFRVARGGSYDSAPVWNRSAVRVNNPATSKSASIGFRLVRDAEARDYSPH